MGFMEALLLAFIILKLTGAITWAWWIVLAPLYPDVILYLILFAMFGKFWQKHKKMEKEFDAEWDSFDERWHLP